MSSKEVKTGLKTAKELIQSEKYDEAIAQCNKVIEIDANNYHALVFLGKANASLKHFAKSLEAYTKATEIQPSQILAWKGIMSLYEMQMKKDDFHSLVKVYEKIISLTDDHDEKIDGIRLKLAEVYNDVKEKQKAAELYKMLAAKLDCTVLSEHATSVYKGIISLVMKYESDNYLSGNVIQSGIEYLLQNKISTSWSCDDLCQLYFRHVSSQNAEMLLAACEKLSNYQINSHVIFELKLSILLDDVILCDSEISEAHVDIIGRLENQTDCKVLNVYYAFTNLKKGNLFEAVKYSPCLLSCDVASFHLLAIEIELALHNYSTVCEQVTKTLKNLQKLKCFYDVSEVTKKLLLCQVEALMSENSTESITAAGKLFKVLKMDHDCLEVNIAMCYLYLILGNHSACWEICERFTGDSAAELAMIGWYHYHTDNLKSAREHLEKSIEIDSAKGLYVYHLARVYWKLCREEKIAHQVCMSTLLKAAKLDPYHSGTFFWLGKYFEKYSHDMEKARRCFRKAYDLKPTNEEAARSLVDSLSDAGEDEEAVQVLRSVTQLPTAMSMKWAWLRLGLYLTKQEPSLAIQCFQSAIRADTRDAYCWQCLADGYLNRGSYNAAVKTFSRANELDPTCVYNLYQLANIKRLLGLHLEAIVDYQKILDTSAEYVPALIGLAENHLYMAREALGKFFSMKAVSNCKLALDYLKRAADHRSDLSIIWKLIGDACSLLYCVPKALVNMEVSGKLLGKDHDERIGLDELLGIGRKAYGKALQICPNDSLLWFDLGHLYYKSFLLGTEETLDNAIKCLRKSISLNPYDTQSWSTLGVVMVKNNERSVAQHCFIKAIEADRQNACAWVNLGVLYLDSSNIALAHEAFKMAQSLMPEYVNGWIGQAMVAETVAHAETADLFRHCSELALHTEACRGYAHWICQDFAQGRQVSETASMHALVCLERYLDRYDNDAVALNTYAILLERHGLLRTAVEASRKALELSLDKDYVDDIRTNYARLLCKSEHYTLSVDEFRKVKEFPVNSGYAFFKAKQYGNAAVEYSKALDIQDIDKSQLTALLGLCSYWLGDETNAKTHFFTCAQASKTSLNGLLAMCSMSILQGDWTLAGAVVKELDKFLSDPASISRESVLDICRVTVLYFVRSGQEFEAREFLQRILKISSENDADLLLLSSKCKFSDDVAIDFAKNILQCHLLPRHFHHTSFMSSTVNGFYDTVYRYAHNDFVCFPDQPTKRLNLTLALTLNILNTDDLEKIKRSAKGGLVLAEALPRTDLSEKLRFLFSCVDDFIEKLSTDHTTSDNQFLAEILRKESPDSVDEEQKDVDIRGTLVRGFMEVLVVGLRQTDELDLHSVLTLYSSSGVYQFDQDIFQRDKNIYERKCKVKTDGSVKFPQAGLRCKSRISAFELVK